MSTDPQPFEEDLEMLEAQAVPEDAVAPVPEPTGKKGKKKKEKKPKAPKAKKEKVPKPPRPHRPGGGMGLVLYRWFPDIYTSMLGLATLALLVAIVLLFLEFWIPYGGQWRPS
jgi:hypothetical protein